MSVYMCKSCGATTDIEPKFLFIRDDYYEVAGNIGRPYEKMYCPRCGKENCLLGSINGAPTGSSSMYTQYFRKEDVDKIRSEE